MSKHRANPDPELRSPSDARYAIIASRWNAGVVDALLQGAQGVLAAHDVGEDMVDTFRVPGAWELPLLAMTLAAQKKYAAIVALGCVVRGETRHYEHVADECARGLMRVALDTGVPVLNGVLAVEREADALARAGGVQGNKGDEVALVAIEMAALMERQRT